MNLAIWGLSHLSISSQTHSHLPRLVSSHYLHKKNFILFNLTQLDDGSHLEFCHLGFRHWHLGFRHLVIFSQIHSETLSLLPDSNFKLIQSDSDSFLPNLMMSAILNSVILDSTMHKTLTQTNSIWLKLIHSHSTWWCQPSWILPSWIQPFWTKKTSLIHSDSTWWWQPSWILPSWIQPFCTKLVISSQIHSTWWSHPILILTQTHSSWTQNSCYSYLTKWWQPSWILPSWILPTLILHKTLTQTNSIWLKLIHSSL